MSKSIVLAAAFAVVAASGDSGGQNVYVKVATAAPSSKDNLVFSPLSAQAVLALVDAGAARNTKTQLDKLVGKSVAVEPIGKTAVVVGAGITLDAAWKTLATDKAKAIVVDSAHAADAADVLGDAGKGLDKDGVILANLLRFKGVWTSQFDKKATTNDAFYVDAKTKKDVPMMHMTAAFGAARTADADAVALPYKDGTRMLLIVPKKKDGLASVEKAFDVRKYGSEKLPWHDVILSMPRFSLHSKIDLNASLGALGVTDA